MTLLGGTTGTEDGAQQSAPTARPTLPAAAVSPASGWRKLAEKLTSPLARAAYWGIASNFFWMLLGALVMLQVLVAGGVDALPAVDW